MVNPALFSTHRNALPAADGVNHHGAAAWAFSPKHQLAQFAATGCLNHTFYADAEGQLRVVEGLCHTLQPKFIAQTAVYARSRGHMKDMPALLAALLAQRDVGLLAQIFPRVIDSGKMLRNFVQILRSGAAGRKSLGTRPKKLVQQWLLSANEKQLLHAAVGKHPSLADVVKMVHPKPREAWQAAWFAWLIGKPHDTAKLPPITRAFEQYKAAVAARKADWNPKHKNHKMLEVPDVPFQMLTALPLGSLEWVQMAKNGSWQMVRQNLNTFARHGVFFESGMEKRIAKKLRDPAAIAQARALPYQLMMAYCATGSNVPPGIKEALQDALETALVNVPRLRGQVVVCPDVSSSMSCPVTGWRPGAGTAVRCVDVAALVAAAVLRKNPHARVLPFEGKVVDIVLNPRDTVLTNAAKLSAIGGGSTACSAPLAQLNREKAAVDMVIMISDNESWLDACPEQRKPATKTLQEWEKIKKRNPDAQLVCIDLQPHGTTQAPERADILNIGGFSDAVFDALHAFSRGHMAAGHWVEEIAAIDLNAQEAGI